MFDEKAKNNSVIATFSGKDERNILSRKKIPKNTPKITQKSGSHMGLFQVSIFSPSNAIINTLDGQ